MKDAQPKSGLTLNAYEARPEALASDNMTLAECSEFLRVSARTIERMLSVGEGPPAMRIGERRLIFRRSDVKKWLESRALRALKAGG